jgi:predicted NAD/FAD-binding protein
MPPFDPVLPGRRVAVIGSGISGLTTAWLLSPRHRVVLFEKEGRLGGHTRTLVLPAGPDQGTPVDTGFIVMNHRNYPLFTRLLAALKVDLEDSDMSFSFHDPAKGFAWSGTNLRSVFATPSSLFSVNHWGMIRDILRFNREASNDLAAACLGDMTLGEYVAGKGYGRAFQERYLFAMGAAIWSCPASQAARFPAEAYLNFFRNHGLLGIRDRPQWRFVKGGSQAYLQAMRSRLGEVRVGSPALAVRRTEDGVQVDSVHGKESFDAVVLASHADQSLALLADASSHERECLGAWRYSSNEVVLHCDTQVMPARRSAWASWNVVREQGGGDEHPVSLSYHMNRLQNLRTSRDYFVTLNRRGPLREDCVIDRTVLTHPIYSRESLATQPKLKARNGEGRTWLAGAYLGYGFHEDGVRSAVEVAAAFGCPLPGA